MLSASPNPEHVIRRLTFDIATPKRKSPGSPADEPRQGE